MVDLSIVMLVYQRVTSRDSLYDSHYLFLEWMLFLDGWRLEMFQFIQTSRFSAFLHWGCLEIGILKCCAWPSICPLRLPFGVQIFDSEGTSHFHAECQRDISMWCVSLGIPKLNRNLSCLVINQLCWLWHYLLWTPIHATVYAYIFYYILLYIYICIYIYILYIILYILYIYIINIYIYIINK